MLVIVKRIIRKFKNPTNLKQELKKKQKRMAKMIMIKSIKSRKRYLIMERIEVNLLLKIVRPIKKKKS